MEKYNLKDFTKGWIVGDFKPSIIQSKEFEFMVRFYEKGVEEGRHLHKVADEITVVISGEFLMNGQKITAGDIIHLKPNTTSEFKCLESGAIAVVKTPSVVGDKYVL